MLLFFPLPNYDQSIIISVLKLTYHMDPDFVGMVPGQRGQTLIPVTRGQP